MLNADSGDAAEAQRTFKQAIAVATKYGGPASFQVGLSECNLALNYLRARQFDDAISHFKPALEIFKAQNGDRALIVGYVLAGAAIAYAGKGDRATSAQLLAAAIGILGPTLGDRPPPKWL